MNIGFAMCGSYCTFDKAFQAMAAVALQHNVIPVFSNNVERTDSRFGAAQEHIHKAAQICGNKPLCKIEEVEPFGPKKLLDAIIVAPCTGNTLGKLANSIADTAVTMAVKSHLRNGRPVVIAISTNDALAGAAENIGKLLGRKHYYFVPFGQDDPMKKPTSMVADFRQIPEALAAALEGKQLQPLLK